MAASAIAEETPKKEKADELQQESQKTEKRGLSSFGSYGGSSEWSPSFGGGHYGGASSYSSGSSHGGSSYGGGHGGSSYGGGDDHHHHHHEHIKTVTIEKKVPVPYEVVKKIPYTVEKKVRPSKSGQRSQLLEQIYFKL